MFVELWTGLRDLAQDNKSTIANNTAKLFTNYVLNDLANEFDWEFLRGEKQLTATAGSGVYSLLNITQPTTSAYYVCSSDATADAGIAITVYGKWIGASSDITITTGSLTLVATANVTGSTYLYDVDSFRKPVTSGTVYVKDNSGTLVATLSATDTYVSNDIRKINYCVNSSSVLVPNYDYVTYQRGNPNDSNLGSEPAYDIDYMNNQIYLMNVQSSTDVFRFGYQRNPRYLVKDYDRPEFPRSLYPAIIEAGYEGWQLRYQDEADGAQAKMRYNELLQEVIRKWIQGKDSKGQRMMPSWYKRRI